MTWRATAKDWTAELLLRSGLTQVHNRLRQGLPIATFHRVLPDELRKQYAFPGLAVTPAELDWFLTTLDKDHELCTVTAALYQWRSPDGNPRGRSRKPLAITFDDGLRDNYEYARPLLAKHGARATFYVAVDAVESRTPLWVDALAMRAASGIAQRDPLWLERLERAGLARLSRQDPRQAAAALVRWSKTRPPAERKAWLAPNDHEDDPTRFPPWDGMMSWEQIRDLDRDGHEIGSHSCSHAILTQCTETELRNELVDSKRTLEAQLSKTVDGFCYPNGNHDARVVAATRAAGYRHAVTTKWGTNPVTRDSDFDLCRFEMNALHTRNRHGSLSWAMLSWRLSGYYPGLRY